MVDPIITLFNHDATDFSTNGLGSLLEATSCKVSEERNGAFELRMDYPITGRHYNDISLRQIILAPPNPFDDPQPFRIYDISRPIKGIITISAAHISYDATGIPVSPFTATSISTALVNMKNACAVICPFTFTTDKSTLANMNLKKPSSLRSVLGGMEGSILDTYRGEYKYDKWEIKLMNNRGANNGVSIRYGKNLTDMKQEENCNDVYTGIYPYWYSEEDGLFELDPKIVNAEGTYNFTKILPIDFTSEFQEKPTSAQLLARAQRYITENNIGVPKVSLTISFISMDQTTEYSGLPVLQSIRLCDTINVFFPEMNVNATAKCIKTEYDVIGCKYISIDIGDLKTTLAEHLSEQNSTIASQQEEINTLPTQSQMEQAIDTATQLVTGGLGGYVVIHSSTGGTHPDEILVMNTDSIDTASKVWRWNQNGFAYSNNGYNGPYGVAITIYGSIVADYITAGVLNGSLLQAGSVQSGAISQSFKSEISSEITGQAQRTEQAFVAADAELRSQILEVGTTASGNYTQVTTQLSELQQSINGINARFTNQYLGGINNVRNSSGLNGVSADWTYSSSVTAEQSAEAITNTVSGSMFILSGTNATPATLSQEVSVLRGAYYTICLRALIGAANRMYCKLDNAGNETYIFDTDTVSSWIDYSYTFQASGDSVTLIFYSYGLSLKVADIMMVEGESKSNWTPAPNEIYTTNVKIDRFGININNPDSSTETIIDNTQFAVKSFGSVVLTVNKDQTQLRKTLVQDELAIGKSRFIPNDNGMDLILLD